MVKVTENSLRDGQQSLLATRMRTEDMLEAAKLFETVGFHSVEVWGGATYDTCLRYLKEDPFERLRKFKEIFKTTPIQMLLRGQNLIGYRHYADDVVREFIRLSAEHGVDIFRIFDALNDLRNLQTAIEEVKKQGKEAQGTLCYTTSPVHDTQTFVKLAVELVKMGCDSIAIKDMAGLLTPMNAFTLVKALKECINVPIALHSHSTAGFAFGTHLKAIEAGVDILDLANSALAEGTSHPCTQSMVKALEGSPHDTKLSLEPMEKAAEILKENRRKYNKFESEFNLIDTRVLLSQIPGGMISNMANQLKEQNALHRMEEVFVEIPKVRQDLGYPPLVTPSSQIVGTQAVLNVLSGERYKQITTETKNLVRGFYGATPAPISSQLKALILQSSSTDTECITTRPADHLAPEMQKAQEESADFAKSPTDVISYAIFGNVAKKFFEERAAGKLAPEILVPIHEYHQEPMPKEFAIVVHGEPYHIKIEGSGAKEEGVRPFFVRVDGELKEVFVETQQAHAHPTNSNSSIPQATAPGHVASPMPGNLTKLKVKVGESVKTGDVLAIVEAMKMEHEVIATMNGTIKEIYTKEGAQVNNGMALMLIG